MEVDWDMGLAVTVNAEGLCFKRVKIGAKKIFIDSFSNGFSGFRVLGLV